MVRGSGPTPAPRWRGLVGVARGFQPQGGKHDPHWSSQTSVCTDRNLCNGVLAIVCPTGTPALKRTPVCRRDPANRPRRLQKQESAETGTPVGNAPSRDAVAINCAPTGRGTRLRGCPAEVSAQADTVNCSRRIYSDGETAAILVLLGVTGQVAPLVSASAPRREVRAGGHLDCLRRLTRIACNL